MPDILCCIKVLTVVPSGLSGFCFPFPLVCSRQSTIHIRASYDEHADTYTDLDSDGQPEEEGTSEGSSPLDQVKDIAMNFFDGENEGGQQVTDYAGAAVERIVKIATTVSRIVTATVIALVKIGEAAKTYLVFSGIVLLILSLVCCVLVRLHPGI